MWHQIQNTKEERKDLHVVFLDLANTFGSIPQNFIWTSLEFFRIPKTITNLIKSYFQDLHLCFTLSDFTTTWNRMEIGIMEGCTISSLLFTMAMEVIIRTSMWVVVGERLASGICLLPGVEMDNFLIKKDKNQSNRHAVLGRIVRIKNRRKP